MVQTILVIEDEPAIRRGVADALSVSGFDVLEAADGNRGLELALGGEPDLVLLDLVLPRRAGMDVLDELRRARPDLPVIILTARGGESERVAGLKAGADDYVVKPFSARELLARVEAVLRRIPRNTPAPTRVRFGSLEMDFSRREIRTAELPQSRCPALSSTEWSILRYLVQHRDRAVSRDELLNQLWGIQDAAATRTIDMHVARLRNKLREAAGPAESEPILTVRGAGYMASRELEVETQTAGTRKKNEP